MRTNSTGDIPRMGRALFVAFAVWLIVGCSVSRQTIRDQVEDSETALDDFTSVVITLGREETVFRWRTDRCEDLDVPDVGARALRRLGEVMLFSGNAPRTYFSYGPDFHRLKRSCTPVLTSPDDWSAASFRNQWWIMSVYSDDGTTIHALVHNEYHDPLAANCRPGDTLPRNPCWYNAITYAVSHDGGRSFRAPSPPHHIVAAPPEQWNPRWGRMRDGRQSAPPPYGYFGPSNIIRGPDGAFYSTFFAIIRPGSEAQSGTCLMRTTDPSSPSSWRLWDGQGFNIVASNPYASPGAAPCAFLSPRELGDLRGSLTYNTYLQRFMIVGTTTVLVNGARVCGMFYSLSKDLITWTPKRILKASPLPWCQGHYAHETDVYPSIIDHADTSVTFENAGQTPYLYFTRKNFRLDRDLLRVQLTIRKTR